MTRAIQYQLATGPSSITFPKTLTNLVYSSSADAAFIRWVGSTDFVVTVPEAIATV